MKILRVALDDPAAKIAMAQIGLNGSLAQAGSASSKWLGELLGEKTPQTTDHFDTAETSRATIGAP